MRPLARGIHPAILEESGLQAALESLVDRSPLDVRTEFSLHVEPSRAAGAAAYFSVSEALTNTFKHAGIATSAWRRRTVADAFESWWPTTGPAARARAWALG